MNGVAVPTCAQRVKKVKQMMCTIGVTDHGSYCESSACRFTGRKPANKYRVGVTFACCYDRMTALLFYIHWIFDAGLFPPKVETGQQLQ